MISKEISVIGLGNWGTALANYLALKGYTVTGWTSSPEVVKSINSAHINPQYLQEFTLSHRLFATTNIDEACNAQFIVFALPSVALSEVAPSFNIKPGSIVVSATKGLDSSLLTPSRYFQKVWKDKARIGVLSGPSFARDIIRQLPSGVVAAADDEGVAKTIADIFSGDRMRVYISTDVLGVELGGIVKNVIAIAAGISDGLSLGDSARAGLITRGLAEIVRLGEAYGAKFETLVGLSGLGDLVMTATCDQSRNRTVGIKLGRGEKLDIILKGLGSVAEGVVAAPIILELAKKVNVEMPITEQVVKLINNKITPLEALQAVISRPIKKEFERAK